MQANWNYPTSIRVGEQRLSELGACCADLNMKNHLLVTDPGLADLPILEQALAACASEGLNCSVFSEVQPNPTGTNVEQGVSAFKEGGHDGVIAFGGGSALDAGKAIAWTDRLLHLSS